MKEEFEVFQKASNIKFNEPYTAPIQSANTLFRFVDNFEYLKDIIKKQAIMPRYCIESIEYLDIEISEIAYPMICFCDINLHKLNEHIVFYGPFGIAFNKDWGIEKGIQPIQYINEFSNLKNDFSEAFKDSLSAEYTDKAQDFLLTQMKYIKPILGKMKRNNKSYAKNFTDECEWRYVPNVKSENYPEVLFGQNIIQRDNLNEAIALNNNLWLKFKLEDIKYLILKSRKHFVELLSVCKELNEYKKSLLLSKIIIWDESKGDF